MPGFCSDTEWPLHTQITKSKSKNVFGPSMNKMLRIIVASCFAKVLAMHSSALVASWVSGGPIGTKWFTILSLPPKRRALRSKIQKNPEVRNCSEAQMCSEV